MTLTVWATKTKRTHSQQNSTKNIIQVYSFFWILPGVFLKAHAKSSASEDDHKNSKVRCLKASDMTGNFEHKNTII